jgi:uncharacterized protein YjbJ (UPF0337 family)
VRALVAPLTDSRDATEAALGVRIELLSGAWLRLKRKIKEQWGRLTEGDVRQFEGHAWQPVGKLKDRYGLARDEAEPEAREFRKGTGWDQQSRDQALSGVGLLYDLGSQELDVTGPER